MAQLSVSIRRLCIGVETRTLLRGFGRGQAVCTFVMGGLVVGVEVGCCGPWPG